MIKKTLITLAVLAGIVLAVFVALIMLNQFTEYKPAPVEALTPAGNGSPLKAGATEFSVLSWNIGYGGMGREMDFFYDGGKTVRPQKEYTDRTFDSIRSLICRSDSVDFLLIQEIDMDSKRTYFRDQEIELESCLKGRSCMFALNYKVKYIPSPLTEPLGKVTAGLSVFSKYEPDNAERHAYDAFFPWPTRLAMLKRCFIASYFSLGNGKQLVILNLHNSAFDNSGELRKRELEQLKEFLQREYQKGNYIIAGGDWNMNPPGYDSALIRNGDKSMRDLYPVNQSIMDGWELAYDPSVPSNRLADQAYTMGKTGTHIIDFFIISPNVSKIVVKTPDWKFRFSDHNPVYMKFRINP